MQEVYEFSAFMREQYLNEKIKSMVSGNSNISTLSSRRVILRMLFDNCGRPTTNLRVSLTQRCNLHCVYCHAEGQTPDSHRREMAPQEIVRLVGLAVELGITKVKLTGGEPLLREDVTEIIRGLHQITGLQDLSMTTNAHRLGVLAQQLREAGLMRVNINLPSLNPRIYRDLNGGSLQDALDGVHAAVKAGFDPVKLNMLILNGVNYDEIDSMIDFARETGAVLQLLELEPIKVTDPYYKRYHYLLDAVEEDLKLRAQKVRTRGDMQSRRVYTLPGVEVEVVHPIENTEFCAHCTRLRLTSDGKLKPCLMVKDNLIDILTSLRQGASDEQLKELYVAAVKRRQPFYKPVDKS